MHTKVEMHDYYQSPLNDHHYSEIDETTYSDPILYACQKESDPISYACQKELNIHISVLNLSFSSESEQE